MVQFGFCKSHHDITYKTNLFYRNIYMSFFNCLLHKSLKIKRDNRKFILFVYLLFSCCQITLATHKVYVIHGYAGSAMQMAKICNGLTSEGYVTENYIYPSFKKNLDSIGLDLYRKVKQDNYDTVSFITHSMGALVVRSMYQYMDSTIQFPFIYRFVMLAPPNKGTEMADFFSNSALKSFLGPNVSLMRTDSGSYVYKLPIPTCETGLIVGIKGKKPWFNPFMKDDNDGTVTMKRAILGNEKEITTVKSMHILMPLKKKVIKLVRRFMKTGSFTEILFLKN